MKTIMEPRTSFRDISNYMDSVLPPNRVSELIGMHRDCHSLSEVFRRHHEPQLQELKFLLLNTYLLQIGQNGITKKSKPEVEARSREIGQFIVDSEYDISVLNEVFQNGERDRILDQWGNSGLDRPNFASKTARWTMRSGGLVTICPDITIRSQESYTYRLASGSDARARKGVLFVQLDLGLENGTLEIYNTHLNASDELVKILQVVELMLFFDEHHNEENPAIIAGDFNIAAKNYSPRSEFTQDHLNRLNNLSRNPHDPLFAGYASIADRLEDNEYFRIIQNIRKPVKTIDLARSLLGVRGLEDVWLLRSLDQYGYPTSGLTSNIDEDGIAELICKPDPKNGQYCNELDVPPDTLKITDEEGNDKYVERLDYIFVKQARSSQLFHLDFTRPRRLRLERSTGEFGWLSDHIGLETTLLVSPK